jgi:hypothetical protein
MTRRDRRIPVLLLVLFLAPLRLEGQASSELLVRGIEAYRNLDFDGAVGFLHRWFAAAAGQASQAQVTRGLTYLGAAEEFRGNRDSAVAAFRRLVLADPRYEVDQMVFPPEVTGLFTTVRGDTKAVEFDVPDSVSLSPGETFTAWAYASSYHPITIQVQRADGELLNRVYRGPIGDSLLVRWDGRDSTDTPLASGSYFLTVTSLSPAGRTLRILQVPFDLTAAALDTLPTPPALSDSLFLPERSDRSVGVEALLGGLATSLGAVALPSLMAPDASLSPARFVLGAGAGIAALIGFSKHRPGHPIQANVQHNDSLRQAWQEDVARVSRENTQIRTSARLRIRFGPATVVNTPQ